MVYQTKLPVAATKLVPVYRTQSRAFFSYKVLQVELEGMNVP